MLPSRFPLQPHSWGWPHCAAVVLLMVWGGLEFSFTPVFLFSFTSPFTDHFQLYQRIVKLLLKRNLSWCLCFTLKAFHGQSSGTTSLTLEKPNYSLTSISLSLSFSMSLSLLLEKRKRHSVQVKWKMSAWDAMCPSPIHSLSISPFSFCPFLPPLSLVEPLFHSLPLDYFPILFELIPLIVNKSLKWCW